MTPTVFITGAAKRLGKTTAEKFASEGWHVIVHYSSSEQEAIEVVETIRETGGAADRVQFDLRNIQAIPDFVARLAKTYPNWTVLVNNASNFEYDDPLNISPDVWASSLEVNCLAPCMLASSFATAIKTDESRSIINILDQKIENLNPDYFSYTVSKGGLKMASEMMAMAFAKLNIRVCNVAPGLSLPSGDQTEEEFEISSKMNLLRKRTLTADIADGVFYLATAKSTTGQTLFVDSGQHMTSQDRDVMFSVRDKT